MSNDKICEKGFWLLVLAGTLGCFALRADIDEAAWIGENEQAPAPRFLRFRCSFEGQPDPLNLTLSADQRYILLLDGKPISRGPAFGDLNVWHSQRVCVQPTAGKHLLEALVWKLGENGYCRRPSAQLTWKTGFILKAEGVYDKQLTTGLAPWRVGVLKGTHPDGMGAQGGAFGVGCQFKVTGTSLLDEEPESFSPAAIVREKGATKFSCAGVLPQGWHVMPSQLPEQLHRIISPGEMPGAFTVAPHTRVEKIFDLGNYYCAYPRLRVRGGKGAKITWSWTEALRDPTIRDTYAWDGACAEVKCSKTDRARRTGMVFADKYAIQDTFLCDGRTNAFFTTPWWRCGRWCRLVVESSDEALHVMRADLEETRYPLREEGSFACDDASLDAITALSVRGVEMCAHELMYDCPFWEQQMYPGDCRVSFLAMAAISADDRLMRQGLEIFDRARRWDGSLPMNWPSSHDQHSATWTLSWVLSLGDYARWHANEKWLRARLPGLEHTMMGLARHENARGLLQDVPGWSYLDWVAQWRCDFFAPPGAAALKGESACLNLLYLRALRVTAEILAACSEPLRAMACREKADKLAQTIHTVFWDARTQRMADVPTKDSFSEHAQAFAILADCLTPAESQRALAAIERRDPDMAIASSFCLHYVFEACRRLGRGDLLLKKLDCWRTYVAMNMNCPLESLVFPRSDCHAFGAHPLFHFHTCLAGVRPDALFFKKVLVSPSPGTLKHIRARTPHPQGLIETSLDFVPSGVSGYVVLPANVTGTFQWQGQTLPLAAGTNAITRMRFPAALRQ